MDENYVETINEFKSPPPARKLIRKAIKEILPSKGNWFGFALSMITGVFFAVALGFSPDTVLLLSEFSDKLIAVQLALFGCIFTVYSILLAFLNDGYMKRLSRIKVENKTSMLKNSVSYYESVLFLYFVNIGITGVLMLASSCLDPSLRLTPYLYVDNTLASIGLLVYFSFTFRVFYEMKSTIYNTIVLFRTSIAYKFIDFCIEDCDKMEDNSDEHKV